MLAEAYQLTGDQARTHRLMEIAGQRSLRDTRSQLWLFQESLAAKRFDDAFTRGDLLLLRNPDLEPYIFPAMVAQVGDPAARSALLARLRRGPRWRRSFMQIQALSGDEDGFAWLLTNLASSPNPPTAEEIGEVAGGLIAKDHWAAARQIWTQFGRAGGPRLFNGDFEQPPRDPPFGWSFLDHDGAVASVETLEGGGHGLFAQFPVGHSVRLAELLLMLEPGRYRLSGRFKIDQLPSEGVFRWTVDCPGTQAPMVILSLNQVSGWRRLQADFEVPAQGCDGQWLRLLGTGGEGYQPASAWFDDLRVEPLR